MLLSALTCLLALTPAADAGPLDPVHDARETLLDETYKPLVYICNGWPSLSRCAWGGTTPGQIVCDALGKCGP